jgi:hypothetical protein
MVRKKSSERKASKEISTGTRNKINTALALDKFVTNQEFINA